MCTKFCLGSLNCYLLTLVVSILITSVLKSTQCASINQVSPAYPTCLPFCSAVSHCPLEIETKYYVSGGRKYKVLIPNQLKFKAFN
jgi:hypothetical protein